MTEPVPGTPQLLRALNDRAALDLLVSHGPLTRARLGELTGLSKVTASQLLSRLELAGLVHEIGAATGARGPSARLYAVDGSAGLAVGLDLDPHRGIARVVDAAGRTLGEVTVQLPRAAGAHDPGRDVHRILEAAAAAARIEGRAIGSVAVGVQGAYDPGLDALTYAAHLPAWSRPGLRAALTTAAGCPVTIENDVNLAAAADAPDGDGPGRGSSAYFWLGDGLRLAIHFGGVLYRGAHGGAGEVGYIPVAGPTGRLPLQDLVGAPAVAALARTHGAPGRTAAEAVALAVATDARADAVADTEAVTQWPPVSSPRWPSGSRPGSPRSPPSSTRTRWCSAGRSAPPGATGSPHWS